MFLCVCTIRRNLDALPSCSVVNQPETTLQPRAERERALLENVPWTRQLREPSRLDHVTAPR